MTVNFLRDCRIPVVLNNEHPKPISSPAKGPVTSPSLLLRIRDADDVESWRIFEDVYGPVIRAFCRTRGFQPNDIDDIVQEVLTSVADAIRRFDYDPQRGRFRSWLATIAANKMRDFARQRAKRDDKLIESVEKFATAPATDSEWSTLFIQKVFKAACDRIRTSFEDSTWHSFEETWLQHRSATDVADELGIPVHSVYVNKSRVLKRLEQEFIMLSDDFPLVEIQGDA